MNNAPIGQAIGYPGLQNSKEDRLKKEEVKKGRVNEE